MNDIKKGGYVRTLNGLTKIEKSERCAVEKLFLRPCICGSIILAKLNSKRETVFSRTPVALYKVS